MTLSFNAIILILLMLYALWMGYSEHRKEKASADALTDTERQRFTDTYSFGRAPEEYPDDIRAHAVLAQRARIRKVAAVVILTVIPLIILFRGL